MNTKKIIFLILIVLVIGAGGWYGFEKYSNWVWFREMKKEADKFTAEQNRLKSLIEADTYGGATPQETLQMFITAVEKGDYELASRYFVVEKQEEWRGNLINIEKDNKFDIFLPPVREAKYSTGSYSVDKDIYISHDPVFVEFIKYPSGLWKIDEI